MSESGLEAFDGPSDGGRSEKVQIGVPDTKGTAPLNEDPSRSALHYGKDHRGQAQESTPDAGPQPFGATAHGMVDAPVAGPAAAQLKDNSGQTDPLPGTMSSRAGPGSEPPDQSATQSSSTRAAPDYSLSDFNPGSRDATEASGQPADSAPRDQEDRSHFETFDQPGPEAGRSPSAPDMPANVESGGQPATSEDPVRSGPEEDLEGQEAVAGVNADLAGSAPVAEVNLAPTEVTLSNGAVAASNDGAVVGVLNTLDANAGDSHSYTLSDDRFEVADGVLRLRAGQSLDQEADADLSIEVTATDPSGNSVSETFDLDVIDMPGVSVHSGFHARYFDVDQSLKLIEDIDWSAEPTHEELISEINYENGSGSFWEDGARDTFGAQITGQVEVGEGGTFTFHLGGDDGAVLIVDGVEVINHDGLHSYQTRTADIELDPGTHQIEIRYFENYGRAGLKLEWEGPGFDGTELVAAPGMDSAQTVSGMPIALELDRDVAPQNSSLTIEGLPEGTIVISGEDQVSVGPDGMADVTGWDMSLLTVTPPVSFTGPIDASILTTVTTETGQSAVASEPLSLEVNPASIEPPPVAMVGGFEACYYDMDQTLRKLEDIDWSSEPTHSEMVREINYENGRGSFWEDGATDTFGAKLEGMIRVEEGGTYDFFLGGDDGVILLIDGVEVIDHDGLHGYQTRSGEIELEPGTHHLEVRYFENYGNAGLKLEWEGPDTEGREMVQADPDLSVSENGMLTVGIETDTMSDAGSVQISGLPAHTIVISGDESAVSDGGPVDLSGWDIETIEIAPPPGYVGDITGEVILEDFAFNGELMSSSSAFSISVGDAEGAPQSQSEEDGFLLAQAWETDGADAGGSPLSDDVGTESDQQDDDVLDQPVEVVTDSDCAVPVTDSYERCDW